MSNRLTGADRRQSVFNLGMSYLPELPRLELVDELRRRLRKSEGARFKAEAQLAIVTREKDLLQERFRRLCVQLDRCREYCANGQ
jgi:hypothetical protein